MFESLRSTLVGLLGGGKSDEELEEEVMKEFYEHLNKPKEPPLRKGVITYVASNCAEIDRNYVFPTQSVPYSIGDKVSYRVVNWGANFEVSDVCLENPPPEKTLQGKVAEIDGDECTISPGDFKFNVSCVEISFKPLKGDYLTLEGSFSHDYRVDKVIPTVTKFASGLITEYDSSNGTGLIADDIFFTACECKDFTPKKSLSVFCTAMECNNPRYKFRAISMNTVPNNNSYVNVEVTRIPFFVISLGENKIIDINVTNCSPKLIPVGKAVLTTKDDIVISSEPDISMLAPRGIIKYELTCSAKRTGKYSAVINWTFGHIKISRTIKYSAIKKHDGNEDVKIVLPGRSKFIAPKYVNVKMGLYPLPDDILQLAETDQFNASKSLCETFPSLMKELDRNTYIDKMHNLLYLEEAQCVINTKMLTNNFCLYPKQDTVYLEFEADSPYGNFAPGDSVLVSKPWNTHNRYEGKIWDVLRNEIVIKLHPQFMEDYRRGAVYTVEFVLNRTPMRKRHFAIDCLYKYRLLPRIFPVVLQDETYEPKKIDTWFNRDLNNEQKSAVQNILSQKNRKYPYIICGPPGTGKTVTVVELILQLCQFETSRIMVVAPTNSAIDLIGVKLLAAGLPKEHIMRLCSYNTIKSGGISSCLMEMSFVPSLFEDNVISDEEAVPIATRKNLGVHKITLGTMQCIGTLCSVGFPGGYFTHIIVDEAGQATEPETLIPLSFLDKENSQFVLAGDPNQLGPVVMSKLASDFGLRESFLLRISNSVPYRRNTNKFKENAGYDQRLITKLVINYRALPKLVKMTSDIFYEGLLVPYIQEETSKEAILLKTIKIDNEFVNDKSLLFIHVEGVEEQLNDSWSFYNSIEVVKIVLLLGELYQTVSPDQIGIITPYNLQAKMIHKRLGSLNLFSPKIGSVEEFQGAERDIVIFSIVRSSKSINKSLPEFISSRNKLNVALSRAKILNIIVGNKNYVSNNELWKDIIDHCE